MIPALPTSCHHLTAALAARIADTDEALRAHGLDHTRPARVFRRHAGFLVDLMGLAQRRGDAVWFPEWLGMADYGFSGRMPPRDVAAYAIVLRCFYGVAIPTRDLANPGCFPFETPFGLPASEPGGLA